MLRLEAKVRMRRNAEAAEDLHTSVGEAVRNHR